MRDWYWLSPPVPAQLLSEVRTQAPISSEGLDEIHLDSFVVEEGCVRAPRSTKANNGGVGLAQLHLEYVLPTVRAAYQPRVLFPTRRAYLYYDSGSYAAPHHDNVHCEATGLMVVRGDPDPLVLYPNAPDRLSEHILNLCDYTSPSAFESDFGKYTGIKLERTELKVPDDRVLVIDGRRVLHGRFPTAEEVVMASFCYAGI